MLLLGSSALLPAHGTTKSLAGRLFLHRCTHWSWAECRAAFGWDLDRWLFFGGHPGTAALTEDEQAWKSYVRDALVEPVLARDFLAMRRVARPALLRHLFALSCHFPAQPLADFFSSHPPRSVAVAALKIRGAAREKSARRRARARRFRHS